MTPKLEERMEEALQRLIHIELKLDAAAGALRTNGQSAGVEPQFAADQWYGSRTWAQHGDDIAVLNIFKLIGNERPTYLDIGAHHPWRISNTALLHTRGSRGINIEANPNLHAEFVQQRPDDLNLNVGVGPAAGTLDFYMIDKWSGRNTFNRVVAETFVAENPQFRITEVLPIPVITLQTVIDKHCEGRFPDFLTLDVEGLDESILGSYDFAQRSRPSVICVETELVGDTEYGSRIKAILQPAGYFVYQRCGSNSIFVAEELRSTLY